MNRVFGLKADGGATKYVSLVSKDPEPEHPLLDPPITVSVVANRKVAET